MATTTRKEKQKTLNESSNKKTPKGVKVNYLTPKSGYNNSVSPKKHIPKFF
jgi:hypothetical protein